MAECSICGKLVLGGANLCSTKCMEEASINVQGKIFGARQRYYKAINSMLEPRQPSQFSEEVNMIKLRHRWLRSRNLVTGSVTASFNADGIAFIPDVGSTRHYVDILIRNSKGLITEIVSKDQPELVPKVKRKSDIIPPVKKESPKVAKKSQDVESSKKEPKVEAKKEILTGKAEAEEGKKVVKGTVKKSPIKKK